MIIGEPYLRDGHVLLRNLQRAAEVPPGYVDTGLQALPGPADGRAIWDGKAVTGYYRPTDLTTAVVRVLLNNDGDARKVLADHLTKEANHGR